MLDRLRPRNIQIQPLLPPQPQKIKTAVRTDDFRKFAQKITPPVQTQSRTTFKISPPQPKPIIRTIQLTPPKVPRTIQLRQTIQPKTEIPKANPTRVKLAPPPAPVIRPQLPGLNGYDNYQKIRGIGKGRILIMIAAGPSVNEVDLKPLKHPKIDIMCINQPHKEMWPSKFWAFCDHTQYKRNTEIWNSFDGIIINSTNVRVRKHNQIIIKSKPGFGFSKDIATGYHIGRSSTYANMQVADYMNYDKIYVFGLDMCPVDGKFHYYGKNPDVSDEERKARFEKEAESYSWAGKNLSVDIRNKFVFCSNYNPWPFIQQFQRFDHKTAVNEILIEANK